MESKAFSGSLPAEAPKKVSRFRNEDTPRSQWAKSRERLAWMLVAPAILVVCGIALYPLLQTIRLSFTDANLHEAEANWVGRNVLGR